MHEEMEGLLFNLNHVHLPSLKPLWIHLNAEFNSDQLDTTLLSFSHTPASFCLSLMGPTHLAFTSFMFFQFQLLLTNT